MCKFCSFIRKLFGIRDDPGNPGFDRSDGGRYHAVFENRPQPTPGAMSYAYESLGLVQQAPSGPTVTVRRPRSITAPQVYVKQGAMIAGVPLTAGQVFGAPLFDPATGYVNERPAYLPSQLRYNIAAPTAYQVGAFNPSPDRAKGAP